MIRNLKNIVKVKRFRNRPWKHIGCEMLRIPQCLDNRLTDGRQGFQPYAPSALYSPETLLLCFWYSFLLEAE
jgi:hypothetical protein